MWPVFKKIMRSNLVLLNLCAEALGGAFVIAELQHVISGHSEDAVYSLDSILYGLGLSTLAAIPAAISLWQSFEEVKNVRFSCLECPEMRIILPKRETVERQIIKGVKDFIVKGVPFGLLDFGGCFIFLNKLSPYYYMNMALSAVGALSSSGSNYYMISRHEKAHISWWAAVRYQSCTSLVITLLMASLTLAGHMFQTFLDLELFDESVDAETNPHERGFWLEEGLSLTVAAIVTALEGYAKLCASLYRNNHQSLVISKGLMMLCSMLHLLLPAAGAVRIADLSYELFHGEPLLPKCHLGLRIALLIVTAASFGLPNARGNYHMHLPALDHGLRKAYDFFRKKEVSKCIPESHTICDNSFKINLR